MRKIRILVALAALPLLLVACGGEQTYQVSANRIYGKWTGPDGERITFAKDRTFESTGLDSSKLKSAGCPGGKKRGFWQFLVEDKNAPSAQLGSPEASAGSSIGISYPDDFEACNINIAVVDEGKALCLTDEVDSPCGLDVKLKKPE